MLTRHALAIALLGVVVAVAQGQRLKRGSSKRLPTQEEADCPYGCRCNQTTVTCRNRGLGKDVFEDIHSRGFPHLDTIEIVGNRFGDISESLFDDQDDHNSVTIVNLTDNKITKIGKNTFNGVRNVEWLYLDNNDIKSVGTQPFAKLANLRGIHLKAAFGDISAAAKADLLALFFDHPRRGWNELQEIDLSNNGLEIINPNTFCKVPSLVRLILDGNNLKKFEVAPKCLQGLRQLVLRGNKLETVPATLYDMLPSLNAVDVSKNPLVCDCALMPFLKIAREDPNNFLNQGQTVCELPSNYRGQHIFDAKADLCESSSSFWPHFLILLAIGGAGLFVYSRFRSRLPTPLPFQFGYQNLNQQSVLTEERVEPEFV
ncbi:unnamed protein product, partial [Mesorhabditis spiculigera]